MSPRHLLSAADLTRDEATAILDDADRFGEALLGREVKKLPTLRGRTIITMFYENSTRTRVSFEVAGKWMSADVINVSASGSSVAKGESLRDTALTLRAAGADALIIRHPASGAAQQLAEWTATDDGGPSVINAGDGTHEHPTQALLDALTIRQRLGGIEGKRVVIVGDILHSRVARSNVMLLDTLGAEVVLVAPPTLLPVGVADWPVTVSHDLDAELPVADAVLMLRVQAERMNGGFFPSAREYSVLLRAVGEAAGAAARQRGGAAPRTDAARYGDLVIGGRLDAIGCAATGFQRCARPDGGAVPPAGGRRSGGDQRMSAVLIRRGVRLYGEGDPVDVLVDDGQIADIGADLADPRRCRRHRRHRPGAAARLRRPAHPPARAWPRIRRRHRNRFGRSGSRRLHGGVRDGQHQPGRRQPGGHRPRVAPRPAGRPGRRAPGRRGHRGSGRNAAHRDGHDGRRRGPGADVLRRRHLRARPAGHAPRAGVRHRARVC